ncbi:BMP family protein [Leucobacter luti]|uniref:Nucleoside-binding protein n=1 Tax=Leucobacter luti TaxID=340320 RepID=A0A4R6RWK7_9MICO|nr:BMP family ABC transporter substrate-binding protein [Leucobacter luti]MCW2288150.1 basic membrane protein A [Leucobacter luti]QYM75874.1 BMP family ABC transporter substrate-binding protein [Leucobacter luti]TCK45688.1 nucleoside-binding protein [Leucobacter luti]TDP91410.1 nucleoside-binding protein [Leucobacter luti]
MNKHIYGAVALAAVAALALSGCSASGGSDAGGGGDKESYAVANVVNGNLGDQGFFDDSETGMTTLKEQGVTTKTLQADANNQSQWKANVESVSTGKYDVVVVGTWQMNDILADAAKKYPKQHYVIYDSMVEGDNIASILYAQNEGSFLAGVLAATTVKNQTGLAAGAKNVGVVGGQDAVPITEFVAGFEAGVKAVDPEMEVQKAFVGDYVNSTKAYDQATAMYQKGAGVVYTVAGQAGLGALKAAKESNKFAIGVDSNQNQIQPGHILASMRKFIGNSIVTAVDADQNGELKYGETATYNLENDGVGLDFENNDDLVPEDVMKSVEDYKAKIISGEITVPTE